MGLNAKGWEMIWIVTALIILAIVSVILRVFSRLRKGMNFGTDDYLCFVSLVLNIGLLVELGLLCSIGGVGIRYQDLSRTERLNFGKLFLANLFTHFLLSPTIKISIICFYRRIFSTHLFQRLTFWINALTITWASVILLICGLQCQPLSYFWDRSIDGRCIDGNTFAVTNQAFQIVMDFVILALPVPMIWNLHRSWQDKLALTAVFGLGGFICFASIFRIITLTHIDDFDVTRTLYDATLWTNVEAAVALTCSCLPIIRGLFPNCVNRGSGVGPRGRSSPGSWMRKTYSSDPEKANSSTPITTSQKGASAYF